MGYKKITLFLTGMMLFSVFIMPIYLSERIFVSQNTAGEIVIQKVYGDLDIDYSILGPNAHGNDYLNIYAKVKDEDTDQDISEDDMKTHRFHIYRDKEGKNLVDSGDLEFDDEDEEWFLTKFDLAWSGSGTFYVTVEFKTKEMSNSVETDISDKDEHVYSRLNIMEPLLLILLIGGPILAVVIVIIFIRVKKQGVSVERKVKESKGEIKIKEISKEEIKAAKKKKKVEPKEKGKTEVKEDLIFSVPKWEVPDEDEE